MQSSELLVTQLGRLANRIVAGEVVFFIGSGFSIDSEKNTAAILVARLVARFEAISDVVVESPAHRDGPLAALCAELKAGLRRTFSLNAGKEGDIWLEIEKNIGLLTEGTNYYQINDWMCSAFDWLLAHSAVLVTLSLKIHARENEHLKRFHAVDKIGHKWPLTPVDYGRFGDLCKETSESAIERSAAGKALFLETMGFGDRAVMAGNFLAAPEYVSGAYVGRLRPRHFALAWMAHEGLLPVVVTTNYDLLLEGAFRLAGMEPQMAEENLKNPLEAVPRADSDLRWNRRLQRFTPIADATEFFSYGDGYESAMLLKIHGCVYRYRYESRTAAGWRNVLPTMVFTFREIQNWREDSWSRDFLRTLMRTRTIAFAGYSTADPVIHDTFRSVYEEMARYRARRFRQQPPQHEPDQPAESGAAFYYSAATKREFHALEVLRASSLAVGATRTELTSHPNMIGFHFESGPGFPKLDEAMLWTYHLAYRQLQRQALESELRRVYNQLFFKPCPDTDAKAIIASFEALVADESARGKALEEAARDAEQSSDPRRPDRVAARRAEMQRAVGWTANFHRQLMRELAAADLLVREPERASRVHAAMRWPWYAAVTDHPDWGAWAVVLELALRCRSAAWLQLKDDWKGAAAWIEPIPADRPALLLPPTANNDRPSAPRLCLSIEVPELRLMMSCRESARTLHLLPRVALSLRAHAVPWRRQEQEQQQGLPGRQGQPEVRALPAPAPQLVWSWALGNGSRGDATRRDAAVFFGGTHVRPFERNAGRRR